MPPTRTTTAKNGGGGPPFSVLLNEFTGFPGAMLRIYVNGLPPRKLAEGRRDIPTPGRTKATTTRSVETTSRITHCVRYTVQVRVRTIYVAMMGSR